MTTTQNVTSTTASSAEVRDIIQALDAHRTLMLRTADGLTEEQARTASTVSALTVASILKHVADTEEMWMRFAQQGAAAFQPFVEHMRGEQADGEQSQGAPHDEADTEWEAMDAEDAVDPRFVLTDADTLDHLRARVTSVGQETARLLETLDLDEAHALPDLPWFSPGETRSVRRVALHVLAEIAQHAGHADVIREAIDGAKTMG